MLEFEPEAVEAIAHEAHRRRTGARALRRHHRRSDLDLMYDLPTSPAPMSGTFTSRGAGSSSAARSKVLPPFRVMKQQESAEGSEGRRQVGAADHSAGALASHGPGSTITAVDLGDGRTGPSTYLEGSQILPQVPLEQYSVRGQTHLVSNDRLPSPFGRVTLRPAPWAGYGVQQALHNLVFKQLQNTSRSGCRDRPPARSTQVEELAAQRPASAPLCHRPVRPAALLVAVRACLLRPGPYSLDNGPPDLALKSPGQLDGPAPAPAAALEQENWKQCASLWWSEQEKSADQFGRLQLQPRTWPTSCADGGGAGRGCQELTRRGEHLRPGTHRPMSAGRPMKPPARRSTGRSGSTSWLPGGEFAARCVTPCLCKKTRGSPPPTCSGGPRAPQDLSPGSWPVPLNFGGASAGPPPAGNLLGL